MSSMKLSLVEAVGKYVGYRFSATQNGIQLLDGNGEAIVSKYCVEDILPVIDEIRAELSDIEYDLKYKYAEEAPGMARDAKAKEVNA